MMNPHNGIKCDNFKWLYKNYLKKIERCHVIRQYTVLRFYLEFNTNSKIKSTYSE